MAYLVYGIVKEPAVAGSSMMGMKGRPVSFVAGHGLCAAVSELEVEEGAPPVSELLVYSKVVEDLHRLQAVVPMRYGCFINGIQAIRNVLQEKQRPYETLLAELEGHVEMGIRILLGDTLRQGVPLERPPRQACPEDRDALRCFDRLSTNGVSDRPELVEGYRVSRSSGQAYLALRKVHYQMHDETLQGRQELIDRYIQAFSGLYAKHRIEAETKNGAVILSLYFLTPESEVIRFRETFGRVTENGDAKALLSGPWPPYNFVTTDIG